MIKKLFILLFGILVLSAFPAVWLSGTESFEKLTETKLRLTTALWGMALVVATLAWVVRTGLEQAPSDEEGTERMRTILDHFRRAVEIVKSISV